MRFLRQEKRNLMSLRHTLSIILLFIVIASSAQDPETEKLCDSVCISPVSSMVRALRERDFARLDQAISNSPKSEVTLRISILAKVLRRQDASSEIYSYYDNGYHERTRERIFNLQFDKSDTVTMEIARDNMYLTRLTKDERLLLILFSGDVDRFDKEWKSGEFKDSYASNYLLNETQKKVRHRGAVVLYSGVYYPIGDNDVFGPNPSFGVTLSSPLENRCMLEFGAKFRINKNDQPFQYYAMNKLNEVDSKASYFMGLIGSVKIYDRKNFIVHSKVGFGLESVETGLWERNTKTGQNEPEKIYHNLETVHMTTGLSAMKGMLNKRYVGVEVGFHACPYQANKNLKTPMDTMAASGELFFRF